MICWMLTATAGLPAPSTKLASRYVYRSSRINTVACTQSSSPIHVYKYVLTDVISLFATPQILDTNKDGKISEAEFGCASKFPFAKLDLDGGRKSEKSAGH